MYKSVSSLPTQDLVIPLAALSGSAQCHRSAARWNGHLSSSTPTISAFYLSNEFCKAFFYARTTSALNSSVNTCYNGNDTHDDKRGSRPAINPAIDHTLRCMVCCCFRGLLSTAPKSGHRYDVIPGSPIPINNFLCIYIIASSQGLHTLFCLWRVNKKLPQGETSQIHFKGQGQSAESVKYTW